MQDQKPKTCRLAIASVVLGVLWIPLYPIVVFAPATELIFVITVSLTLIIGLSLGVVAMLRIRQSAGLLAGKVIAIAGITISAFSIILGFVVPSMSKIGPHGYKIHCMGNMHTIGGALRFYADENNGKYPAADEWCDLVKRYVTYEPERRFVCPTGGHGPCHYAINPNCQPNSPLDTVLLFETKGGWNQFGGAELLTFENHRGKGCNVLFNDGHLEFIKPEDLGKLKWEEEKISNIEQGTAN